MRQLDKLLEIAANENKLTKHELEIDGHDLTFWSKPMTIAEYQSAKKASKDPDDMMESTARLFIKKALDENGSPQYQIDAIPVLMRVLSMQTAAKLMGAMNELRKRRTWNSISKVLKSQLKKENQLLAELHVAKELGMTLANSQ